MTPPIEPGGDATDRRRRRRPTSALLILVASVCAATSCGSTDRDDTPPPTSTYTGAHGAYRGEGVLLVVTWADWASVWPLTRDAVELYRATQPAGVDFQYVNADEQPDVVRMLGSEVVPSVVVVRDGGVVDVHGNLTDAAELGRIVERHRVER